MTRRRFTVNLSLRRPFKFIRKELAPRFTTYAEPMDAVLPQPPGAPAGAVTARDFAPGESREAEYTSDAIEWADPLTCDV